MVETEAPATQRKLPETATPSACSHRARRRLYPTPGETRDTYSGQGGGNLLCGAVALIDSLRSGHSQGRFAEEAKVLP
jgi:hypothetical protein